jgi:hypothetical protein
MRSRTVTMLSSIESFVSPAAISGPRKSRFRSGR